MKESEYSFWHRKMVYSFLLKQVRRFLMPIVTINMLPGRDEDTKKNLIKNVSAAIIDTLKVPDESVRIIINEMAFEHYGVAGLPVLEYREKVKTKPAG
jgi:4-oxalocrotonate tautomerase